MSAGARVPGTNALQISHGPYLHAPSETGITISWVTTQRAVSRIEYKRVGDEEWVGVRSIHHGLVDADVTQHNVRLTGLHPGVEYAYRVVSREIKDFQPYSVKFGQTLTNKEQTFRTLDREDKAFSFVVVNDRHDLSDPLRASWKTVNWTEIDLALLNGDMVNAVKDERQLYRSIVDPCVDSFAGTIPFVYVRGNHDTRGSFARQLMNYFPTESGRFYYTFRHGPVVFLVLDCGEDKADDSNEYSGLVSFDSYMEQQKRWLAKAVKSTSFREARFRVCLIHIPPASGRDEKFVKSRWLWRNFVPLLNEGKLDLMICGHTHEDTVQPAGVDGLAFPLVVGGTETVIRADVTQEEIQLTSTCLSGTQLPKLPSVKARGSLAGR